MNLSKPQQVALMVGVVVLVLLAVSMAWRSLAESTPERVKVAPNSIQPDPMPQGFDPASRPRIERGPTAH